MSKKEIHGLHRLSQRLFESVDEQKVFESYFVSNQVTEKEAIVWLHDRRKEADFKAEDRVEFQPAFVDVLTPGQQVSKNILHDSGAYYCLDFSSVFAASPLQTIKEDNLSVLDMCAAPGGKSILAKMYLQPIRNVCNEVIQKRTLALISNLKRCAIRPSEVHSKPVHFWGSLFPGAFPVVLVDAPCSGQSLLLKGSRVPGAFNTHSISGNAKRQRQIIAESSKVVAEGGYLLYMTCTFSDEENEKVIEWFLKKFSDFKTLEVSSLKHFKSHLTSEHCYRLWPQQSLGAGAFTCLLKRDGVLSPSLSQFQLPRPMWQLD